MQTLRTISLLFFIAITSFHATSQDTDRRYWSVEVLEVKPSKSEAFEEVMKEIQPEAFAVVKETARRLTENKVLKVRANDYDRELAETRDHIEISGDTAIYHNSWEAAGAKIEWQPQGFVGPDTSADPVARL